METLKLTGDWAYALCEAYDHQMGGEVRAAEIAAELGIVEMIAEADGENDEANWLAVFRLADGRHAFLSAGCDYTGWDCIASGSIDFADTLEDLCRMSLSDEDRSRLGCDVFGGLV